MKKWINAIFYIICFLLAAMAIYRLAFCIPPEPGEEGYTVFCLYAGGAAVLIAGPLAILGCVLDWLLRNWDLRKIKEEKKEEDLF